MSLKRQLFYLSCQEIIKTVLSLSLIMYFIRFNKTGGVEDLEPALEITYKSTYT